MSSPVQPADAVKISRSSGPPISSGLRKRAIGGRAAILAAAVLALAGAAGAVGATRAYKSESGTNPAGAIVSTPTATSAVPGPTIRPQAPITSVPLHPRIFPTATYRFIPYPGNGGGPTRCRDGSYSHSSGRGTCSHHGGIAR